MQWTIEMWYYEQKENDLNGLARTVFHMLLFIIFCYFQRGRMGGIQEFQSMVLNLENKGRMQDKEMERNGVMPYKCLGKISDILHLNNKNNQLERRVRPPKDIH